MAWIERAAGLAFLAGLFVAGHALWLTHGALLLTGNRAAEIAFQTGLGGLLMGFGAGLLIAFGYGRS
jgi:hypothetical protein